MLKIGQKVTSKYYPHEQDIVRKILAVDEDANCGSGYRVSADGGEPCKECGRTYAPINRVDGGWFIPVT